MALVLPFKTTLDWEARAAGRVSGALLLYVQLPFGWLPGLYLNGYEEEAPAGKSRGKYCSTGLEGNRLQTLSC